MIVLSKKLITRAMIVLLVLMASGVFVLYASGGSVQVLGKKDDIPIYSVKTTNKQVSLTFDAAWGTDLTAKLLDIFDKYNIKVTFFVTGMWANKNPEVLKEIVRRGHEVGSHSYTHKDMVKMSDAEAVEELTKTADTFERITGMRPTVYRAPYGSWNTKLVDIVGREQYLFIQWDVEALVI